MRKLQLCVLFFLSLVLCLSVQAKAGDLSDILKEKGIITEEEAKEAKESGSKEKTLRVLERIDFKADLRLRHDTQWRDEDGSKYARNRERFRLRLGAKAKTTETTEVGVRLASGSGFQNSLNQSFDGHGRGKEIFIDLAYANWEPADFFKITGGKQKNPLFTTPLVWDPDVNPEGVSEKIKFDVTDEIGIFANLGQLFIEELNKKDTDADPTLLAYQLGLEVKPAEKLKFQLAGTYYDFLNLDTIDYDDLTDTSEFQGYNHEHSQQMIFDGGGDLLNEFRCWELGAKLSIKDVLPVPFSIFGDYIENVEVDINELIEKGVDPGDSDPTDLRKYSGDDRGSGWLIGLSLGKKKKKGDWYLKYHCQELQDYAFPALFVDSDFHGGGTNNKGHYIHGRYLFTDNIQARATGFFTEREDERKDGKKDENRIQLDVVFEF